MNFFKHLAQYQRLYRVLLGRASGSWFVAKMRMVLTEVLSRRVQQPSSCVQHGKQVAVVSMSLAGYGGANRQAARGADYSFEGTIQEEIATIDVANPPQMEWVGEGLICRYLVRFGKVKAGMRLAFLRTRDSHERQQAL